MKFKKKNHFIIIFFLKKVLKMVMVQNLLVLNNMILFVDSFVPVFVVIEMHTQLNCFFLPGKVEDCTKNYRLSNTKNLCYL